MAACAINQSGVLLISPEINPSECVGYVLLTPADYQATQVDPALVAQSFSYGFSLIVVSYLFGLVVGSILRTVRSARR